MYITCNNNMLAKACENTIHKTYKRTNKVFSHNVALEAQ